MIYLGVTRRRHFEGHGGMHSNKAAHGLFSGVSVYSFFASEWLCDLVRFAPIWQPGAVRQLLSPEMVGA